MINPHGLDGGYHYYELEFNPLLGVCTLFVDDVEWYRGYTGMRHPDYGLARSIYWGSGASADFPTAPLAAGQEGKTTSLILHG